MEEEKMFNFVEIEENNGKGTIKIDNTEIKCISNYELKRDTDMVKLTICISVPPKNLRTIY
jgi:hypothetical protein